MDHLTSPKHLLRLAAATSALCLCLALAPATAAAQTRPSTFDIPSQPLDRAIHSFRLQSGVDVVFDRSLVGARTSAAVTGSYLPEEALRKLLGESGLRFEMIDAQTAKILPPGHSALPAAPPLAAAAADARPLRVVGADQLAEELVVTGSRIRGALPSSPVIAVSQQQMLDAGHATLTEALRAIPQNFSGGQNPGIAVSVPESRGISLGAAYGINLRGVGPEATLTLLNGHRMSYNVVSQSVDASAIPFGAVDRIEIVADGASALYGSDAVAGVANIVLRRDYDGFSTSARFGASTDGGNIQQQYSAVGGTRWDTGGFVASAEVERDTPILASQRDYAARSLGLWLYPYLRHQNALVSGHQELTRDLTFELDALYNRRNSATEYAIDSRGDYRQSGARTLSNSEAMALAPTLKLALGDWRTSLTGSYGFDHSTYDATSYASGAVAARNAGCYCNESINAEWNADGPVFALPGGDAKIAVGGGYRSSRFHGYRTVGAAQNILATQDTYYGFGEASLPLLAPDNRVLFVHRLQLSAALRYEDFPGTGQVAAPKVGVRYAPVADVELKASWGKSFHAPALYQLYNSRVVNLRTAQSLGGTSYPAGATALQILGGNPDLRPERATAWTTSAEFRPSGLPGAKFEIGYFNISYRDRIAVPIASSITSLGNPAYAGQVTLAPSAAQKTALLASGAIFQSQVAQPYDANTVVAIVNNSNQNVASQQLSGIDIAAEYKIDLRGGDTLTLNGDASYLQSSQRLNPQFVSQALAGTVYNPPHLRARAGAVWNSGGLTLAAYGNYTGGSRDVRQATELSVGSLATLDLHAGYRAETGLFRDTEISLSVQNALNGKPPVINGTQVYEPPFDSTNYNAFGRFVSVRLTRKW